MGRPRLYCLRRWRGPSFLFSILSFPFEGLSFTLASAILHAGYFVVLQEAYREGELSVVYPVARGTGPVLSTAAAIAVLGERPSALALGGAVLVAISVFALARPARASAADVKRAVALGLITGVLIAGYTLCDKQAVGPFGVPPLIQQWGGSVGMSVILAPVGSSPSCARFAITCGSTARRSWRSGCWCRRRIFSCSRP